MERKFKLYLETTIFNFVFADDAPEKQAATLKLFEKIKSGEYEVYTSSYVLDELNNAGEVKRNKMLALIEQYDIQLVKNSTEILHLAREYIKEGMIPEKYLDDALHVASASVNNMSAIISWNFKHIVKMKTIRLTDSINTKFGFGKIYILTPMEVIEND